MTPQLDLFAMPAAAPVPPAPRKPAAKPAPAPVAVQLDLAVPVLRPERTGGMPRGVAERWALACTVAVRQDLLGVAMARPGEWLRISAFRPVAQRYNISFCYGHALGLMVRAGMLETKPRYFGSDHPGKPGYEGFENLWRWRVPLLSIAREGFGPCVS